MIQLFRFTAMVTSSNTFIFWSFALVKHGYNQIDYFHMKNKKNDKNKDPKSFTRKNLRSLAIEFFLEN